MYATCSETCCEDSNNIFVDSASQSVNTFTPLIYPALLQLMIATSNNRRYFVFTRMLGGYRICETLFIVKLMLLQNSLLRIFFLDLADFLL
jgi:hypothetical protein